MPQRPLRLTFGPSRSGFLHGQHAGGGFRGRISEAWPHISAPGAFISGVHWCDGRPKTTLKQTNTSELKTKSWDGNTTRNAKRTIPTKTKQKDATKKSNNEKRRDCLVRLNVSKRKSQNESH